MSYETLPLDVTDVPRNQPADPSTVARWRTLGARGLDLLFPWCCVHCDGEIRPSERGSANDYLCLPCRGHLTFSPLELCRSCGGPLTGGASESCRLGGGEAVEDDGNLGFGQCSRCVDRQRAGMPSSLDGVLWSWVYASPISTAVTAMKFRGLDYLADKMAASALDHVHDRLPVVDAIVPVPLHWSRRWARGYDQAELLAVGLSRRLGLARERWLRRARRTSAQSLLNETERRANLASAFRLRRKARPQGRRILLVDDVITTGATLEAAAGALKNGGATQIFALAVARTPQPEELFEL